MNAIFKLSVRAQISCIRIHSSYGNSYSLPCPPFYLSFQQFQAIDVHSQVQEKKEKHEKRKNPEIRELEMPKFPMLEKNWKENSYGLLMG
jgi:hypothetical protein